MDRINHEEIKRMTREQEEYLRFDTFSNEDALSLGMFITERVYKEGIDLAISIRRLNGAIIFQHLTEGTDRINQNWMDRKFNTVAYFGHCSLAAWADAEITGEDIEFQGLSKKDFAFCGGGFPVRLKSGELVAVAIVSNLPHMRDHSYLVQCIEDYLNEK